MFPNVLNMIHSYIKFMHETKIIIFETKIIVHLNRNYFLYDMKFKPGKLFLRIEFFKC